MSVIPFTSDSEPRSSLEKALAETISALGDQPDSKGELRTLHAISLALTQFGFSSAFFDVLNRDLVIAEPKSVQVTGYYLPELAGSLARSERFPFPIYSMPDGALPTRAEIDGTGVLAGKGLEIAWVSDAIDLFFLHIQGSGILRLEDDSTKMLQYAGNNGAEYRAIGKLLVDRGELAEDQLSMQTVKEYLRNNRERLSEILQLNPRYVFYRLGEDTAFTTLGTPVTSMRTIASDWKIISPGSVGVLRVPGVSTGFIVVNQDTGSAIKGDRIDLFTGSGKDAEQLAGKLNQFGTISLISGK